MSHNRAVLFFLGWIAFAGCNDNGGGGSGNGIGGSRPPTSVPLQQGLVLSSNGGVTSGSIAAGGGRGGNLDVTSGGNLLIGVNPSPLPPGMPSEPPLGSPVGSWMDVQTVPSGNAFIDGEVTAGTTGDSATLNVSSGDLVIRGALVAGDNGPMETNLIVNVPAGTVWIFGSIRSGRVDGMSNGDSGGHVQITALRIIFAGSIDTRGEEGESAGKGGNVVFDTSGTATGQTGQVLSGGSMELSGGEASGGSAAGGDGGSFMTAVSNGVIHMFGTAIVTNGGGASGTGAVSGGDAGDLSLQGNAGVFFNSSFTGVGGNAASSTSNATAGRGGRFRVNTLAMFDSGPVSVFGTITANGGIAAGDGILSGGNGGLIDIRSGSDVNLGIGNWALRGADSTGNGGAGGDADFIAEGDLFFDGALDVSDGHSPESVASDGAGAIRFDTLKGSIQLSGTLLANGGNGSAGFVEGGPSNGGTIRVRAGAGGGTITLRGIIQANGGADSNGINGNQGGAGGIVQLICRHPSGSIYLDPSSAIIADGGAGSLPEGSPGGRVELLTGGGSAADSIVGGHISLRGQVLARGGAGLGRAGMGGTVVADSDSTSASFGGGDGRGGNITNDPGATIDASGGDGSSPAVTFDADGSNSNDPAENGVVQNLGFILARGTGPGADGGNVLFDGLSVTLAPGPWAGGIDLSGEGGSGIFTSQ